MRSMSNEINKLKQKLIWQMTGEELVSLFKYENIYITNRTKRSLQQNKIIDDKYVYGLKGIAKLFNCSISSAMRLKKSGKIKDAITQEGRKIVLDVERALVLINNEYELINCNKEKDDVVTR